MTDKYYQLADYILNHYDKTSHNDKLVLAKRLKQIYNDGIDTAISLTREADIENYANNMSLICGLENSKL